MTWMEFLDSVLGTRWSETSRYRMTEFYTTVRNDRRRVRRIACYDFFMRVGLFVTCLVDLMRPSIGFATIKLLESAGCDVVVPETQTCCGQPGYNSGDRASALALARKVIAEFEACDYVVAPSGSCAGMIRTHYPDLFRDAPDDLERALKVCAKTYELADFLVNVAKLERVPGGFR